MEFTFTHALLISIAWLLLGIFFVLLITYGAIIKTEYNTSRKRHSNDEVSPTHLTDEYARMDRLLIFWAIMAFALIAAFFFNPIWSWLKQL
jgi:hypothetical protein